jgi:benzil reductase ((S)-benzoin forming)
MFTRCVALEQEGQAHPVKVYSFAPGVIDTEMQGEIRKSSEEDFAPLKRFIAYYENGDLMPPAFVAKKAIELMTSNAYENGQFIDVYEMI